MILITFILMYGPCNPETSASLSCLHVVHMHGKNLTAETLHTYIAHTYKNIFCSFYSSEAAGAGLFTHTATDDNNLGGKYLKNATQDTGVGCNVHVNVYTYIIVYVCVCVCVCVYIHTVYI